MSTLCCKLNNVEQITERKRQEKSQSDELRHFQSLGVQILNSQICYKQKQTKMASNEDLERRLKEI
jgi:hypothetical protein